jgi:hypothetical protein
VLSASGIWGLGFRDDLGENADGGKGCAGQGQSTGGYKKTKRRTGRELRATGANSSNCGVARGVLLLPKGSRWFHFFPVQSHLDFPLKKEPLPIKKRATWIFALFYFLFCIILRILH